MLQPQTPQPVLVTPRSPDAARVATLISASSSDQRLVQRLHSVLANPDSGLLVYSDAQNPERLTAVASVSKSQHDSGSWGISIARFTDSAMNISIEKSAIDKLMSFAHSKMSVLYSHPNPVFGGVPILKYPSRYISFSAASNDPGAFHSLGFQTVHTHSQDGARVSWLLKISSNKFCASLVTDPIGFSTATAPPVLYDNVRQLQSVKDFKQCDAIIAREWGAKSAVLFADARVIYEKMPGSAVYGVWHYDRLMGVGAVTKALHHDEAWSKSWVVVDKAARQLGLGRQLVQGLNHHAQANHPTFSTGPLVMEGFTEIPDYYRKFGTVPVATAYDKEWGCMNSWSMTVTK